MIPIRDTQVSHSVPVATYLIIAVNLVIFGFQLRIGFDEPPFYYIYGFVPAKYTVPEVSRYFSGFNHVLSFFSYMFLHGGIMHFIGNMWSLYIFGDNVEEHFGSLRFLGFYLICGIVSGFFHFLSAPTSMVPTIGASGAIAGVMGAYFLLFPRSRILTLIPIIVIPWFVEIPAFIFLGIWFVFQFLNAAGSGAGAGIAWWAHIGGFVIGFLLVKLNTRVPESGLNRKMSRYTTRKHSPKLQMIVTGDRSDSGDLFGDIDITTLESITGTHKLVSVPWGFHKPLYRVRIPPGVRQGTRLKLSGLGKPSPVGSKGDLYLTVNINNAV